MVSHDVALVVIDVQTGMFDAADPVHAGDLLLERIQGLLARARNAHVPVVYVQHNAGAGQLLESGTSGWKIHPDIAPLDGEIRVQKHTPDAFHETTLQQELSERGIRKLVLTGIQTDVCVDTTCRRAFSMGYEVLLVNDAHSTWDSGALSAAQIIDHHNEILRWFADSVAASDVAFGG